MQRATTRRISPLSAIRQFRDKEVFVMLKSGNAVMGILRDYDNCMNLVLEDAKEVHPVTSDVISSFPGKIVVRGSQVVYISHNGPG